MVLIEALKRVSKNLHPSEIFREFIPCPSALFSLNTICNEGYIAQRWTSSTEILSILASILKKQSKFKLSLEQYSSGICLDDLREAGKYPLLLTVANRLG